MSEVPVGLLESIIVGYKYLFLSINLIFDSYGWSVIFLSFATSFALAPIMKLSNKAVIRAIEYESVLTPQIVKIKTTSTGEKQHRRIEHLYKRYNYSPFMALIKLSTLFVQIPTLILTYYMLDDLFELKGAAFLWLNDLSLPDNLLYDINILPFAMTVFNLVAALTTPGFAKKDLVQVAIIALLFMLILYNQSSGLLLYWTMNNAILVVRNARSMMILRKNKMGTNNFLISIVEMKKVLLNKYILAFAAFIFVLFLVSFKPEELTKPSQSILGIIFSLPILFSLISFRYLRRMHSLLYGLFALQIMAPASIVFGSRILSLAVYGVVTLSYLIVFLLCVDKDKLFTMRKQLESGMSEKHLSRAVFGYFALGLFILLIDNPLAIYSYDPKEFYDTPPATILGIYLGMFVLILAAFSALLKRSSVFIKELALPFLMFLVIFPFFIYSKLLRPDFGLMDNFVFNQPRLLIQDMFIDVFEIVAIVTALWFVILNMNKFSRYHFKMVIFIFSVSILTVSVNLISVINSQERIVYSYADANDFVISFSREKENVLIILLDGFSAGKLPELMLVNESVKSKFKDFVWYKNAISSAAGTIGAISGIVGGHQYTADVVVNEGRDQINQVINDSYPVMPRAFADKGYETYFINPAFDADLSNTDAKTYKIRADYTSNRSRVNQYTYKLLFMLSTFRTVPMFMKHFIYDHGRWLLGRDRTAQHARKAPHFRFLEHLSTHSITVNEKPTLSFIHLQIPHMPWVMTKDGLGSIDDVGEYIYEAKYSLLMLSDLFDRMKEAGVYDITQIQIISDHGWWVENDMFSSSFVDTLGNGYQDRRSPGFLHALMLVKQPNSSFEQMKESNRLVTNADVPSIACEIIGGCDGIMESPLNKVNERVLKYNVIDLDAWPSRGNLGEYLVEQWEVKNNIFDEKNWHQIFKGEHRNDERHF